MQKLVPPDTTTPAIDDLLSFSSPFNQAFGSNVLLLVPTENQFKTKVLENIIEQDLQGATLITRQLKVDTGIEQPYDEKFEDCVIKRLKGAFAFLECNPDFLGENSIGRVEIGVIENYIRLSDGDSSAVDFGSIIIHNATIGKTRCSVSRGVTVQMEYVKEARERGFVDPEEKGGICTVGNVLKNHFDQVARHKFGGDYDISKDWHLAVSGESRYALLEEAARKVYATAIQECIRKA